MKHIVIDLEMNALDKKFKDERIICGSEIIQIGAVLLDEQYQEIGSLCSCFFRNNRTVPFLVP